MTRIMDNEPTWVEARELAKLLRVTTKELEWLVETKVIPEPQVNFKIGRWNWRHIKAGTQLAKLGHIYFIECGDFIKIGFTMSVTMRLRTIQGAMPYDCRLMHTIPGTLATEQAFLEMFSHIKHRGEWFHKKEELLDFIARLKAR